MKSKSQSDVTCHVSHTLQEVNGWVGTHGPVEFELGVGLGVVPIVCHPGTWGVASQPSINPCKASSTTVSFDDFRCLGTEVGFLRQELPPLPPLPPSTSLSALKAANVALAWEYLYSLRKGLHHGEVRVRQVICKDLRRNSIDIMPQRLFSEYAPVIHPRFTDNSSRPWHS